MAARVSLHGVLRALVRGDRALLHDAEWVEQAVRVIDADEHASDPAPKLPAPELSPAWQADPDGTVTPAADPPGVIQ